jgi:hypothetical protein
MPSRRFDSTLRNVLVVVRTLGWLSAVGAFLIQAHMIQRWRAQLAAAMPGLVAAIFAMINDSLYLASRASCLGERLMVPPLSRTATILWDVAALLVSAGDLILPVAFSMGSTYNRNDPPEERQEWQDDLERTGMIAVGIMAVFRLTLIILMCMDRERTRQRRQRRRTRRDPEQAEQTPTSPVA